MSKKTRREFMTDSLQTAANAGWVASGLTVLHDALNPIAAQAQVGGALIRRVGNAMVWGSGTPGTLGRGDMANFTAPVILPGRWVQLSIGLFGSLGNGAGIKPDGTLWMWGDNTYGQLGNNTTGSPKSTPVMIGTATTWASVVTVSNRTHAIQTDGTLWSWGFGGMGCLGLNSTTNFSTPMQVGALNGWMQVSGGNNITCAIRSPGSLWGWGTNTDGQIGDNTVTNRSSPVQVGTLSNWASVSVGSRHTVAVKTDGTLWAWGNNANGQVGDGTLTSRSSPVQIGANANWTQAVAGTASTLALRSDGSLWAWGGNTAGQLGQSNTIGYSSPVQVMGTWTQVAIGGTSTVGTDFVLAIRTDGTLWGWGANSSGQIGVGDTITRSSPVQVGTSTGWVKVAVGNSSSSGLR